MTASKLHFLLEETGFALLVNGSVPFGHHSALSDCDSLAVVVGHSLSDCDSLAVVVGHSLSGCDSLAVVVGHSLSDCEPPAVVVGCGGFWTAAVEPVTVHHIHHLQPQLWPPPATPSLAGWLVALSACSSGTAGSSGPGDAPPGIASSPPACSFHDAPTLFDPPFSHYYSCKQLPVVLETFGRE